MSVGSRVSKIAELVNLSEILCGGLTTAAVKVPQALKSARFRAV